MGHPKDNDFGDQTELADPELVAKASKTPGVVVRSESQIQSAPKGRGREDSLPPAVSPKSDVSISKILAPGATPRAARASGPAGPATEAWTDDPWDRTSHAREGAALAKIIETKLARWTPAAGPPRRVVVREPEERTGGGARARLPIAIHEGDNKTGGIVIGWLDPSAGRIDLRPYAFVDAFHQERFQRPWDVTVDDYARLVRELADLARARGLVVAQAANTAPRAPAEVPPPPTAQPGAVPQWVWVAVGILLGIAATIAAVQL